MKVSRDGSFVRIDLPPPGRWVIAMCPNTAMHLAHVLGKVKVGKYDIDGAMKVQLQAIDENYVRLTFPPWPGGVYWTECEVEWFCRQLRHASQSSHEVVIPSSGAEVQSGM